MLKRLKMPFFLSLMGHLLILVNLTYTWIFKPFSVEKPFVYVPTYVYQPPVVSPPPMQAVLAQPAPPVKSEPVSKWGIKKPVIRKTPDLAQQLPVNQLYQLKPLAYSPHTEPPEEESKETLKRPLLKLLHDAAAQKLIYPKSAIDFNESGLVKVGFTISPNGQVDDVTLLQSSGSEFLDNAALAAINNMWPVHNVAQYLKKPEFVAAYIQFKLEGRGGVSMWE